MKRLEIAALRFFQVLTIGLGTLAIFAIGYAFVQIATGNIHSTSSFEF